MYRRTGSIIAAFPAVLALAAVGAGRPAWAGIPGQGDIYEESAAEPVTEPAPAPEAPAAEPGPVAAEPLASPDDAVMPPAAELDAPVADAPAAEPPVPAPAPAKRRSRLLKKPRWPGRYIGARAGAGGGLTQVTAAKESVAEVSPVLGVEFGYGPRKWGAAVTLDAALSQLKVGLLLAYVPNQKLRWVAGINPFALVWAADGEGLSYVAYGFGVRAGAHLRLSALISPADEIEPMVWEGFAYASVDRLTEGEDRSGPLPPSSGFTGSYSVTVGAQLNFSL